MVEDLRLEKNIVWLYEILLCISNLHVPALALSQTKQDFAKTRLITPSSREVARQRLHDER